MEAQMNKIPLSVKDTTVIHISPQGDTISIHRKVLKDGEIEQEVTVNRHSIDTADAKFFTYRARAGKNRMYFRNMGPGGRGDETFACGLYRRNRAFFLFCNFNQMFGATFGRAVHIQVIANQMQERFVRNKIGCG